MTRIVKRLNCGIAFGHIWSHMLSNVSIDVLDALGHKKSYSMETIVAKACHMHDYPHVQAKRRKRDREKNAITQIKPNALKCVCVLPSMLAIRNVERRTMTTTSTNIRYSYCTYDGKEETNCTNT